MKICFLAPANNYHIQKWCEYFVGKGHKVDVISLTKGTINNVTVHYIDCGVKTIDGDLKKIKYLKQVKKVKNLIKQINPDIINAHYASSYGMIAALSKVNYVLSVWGTDVYEFPKKSKIHKMYFNYILKKSDYIFSTSNVMKEELEKYTNKKIYVTYFGVKMDLFKPYKKPNEFIVGTIKGIDEKYGIKNIIEAISIINKERPDIKLEVRIAGIGKKEDEYKKIAKQLNVDINWLGFISQEDAAKEWSNMSIALFPSNFESFGVSTIEAEACETPVIVTDAPGLFETTIEESRILISKDNSKELADAIIELYDNPSKREQMGKAGRKYVVNKYEYNKCFKYIEDLFEEIRGTHDNSNS